MIERRLLSCALLLAALVLPIAGCSRSIVVGTTQDVWQRVGPVNYGYDSGAIEEPTVIVERACRYLGSYNPCWKMWYSDGINIGYAESPDGIKWTIYPDLITGHLRSSVYKIGSTYYMWASSMAAPQIDEFTSSDGVNWTLNYPAVITPSSPSAPWSSSKTEVTNTSEVFYNGMLYLWLETEDQLVLYTSTDLHTFTPNSVAIPNSANYWRGPSLPYKISGTWYIWTHGTCSGCHSDRIERMSALTLTGPWTDTGVTEIRPMTVDEGINSLFAQTADPFILEYGGKTYLYYTASQLISINEGGSGNWVQVTKLAIADMPMSQLVLTNGGDDTAALR